MPRCQRHRSVAWSLRCALRPRWHLRPNHLLLRRLHRPPSPPSTGRPARCMAQPHTPAAPAIGCVRSALRARTGRGQMCSLTLLRVAHALRRRVSLQSRGLRWTTTTSTPFGPALAARRVSLAPLRHSGSSRRAGKEGSDGGGGFDGGGIVADGAPFCAGVLHRKPSGVACSFARRREANRSTAAVTEP